MRLRTRTTRFAAATLGAALLAVASATALSAFRPLPSVPTNCGFADDVVPDFTLSDVNPNSEGYGESIGLSELLGQVLVIYWANAE